AAGWIVKAAVGYVTGPVVGAVTFVGLSVGSYIATGSIAPGARLAEGILWMAGPMNTLYAVAASVSQVLGAAKGFCTKRSTTGQTAKYSKERCHRTTSCC